MRLRSAPGVFAFTMVCLLPCFGWGLPARGDDTFRLAEVKLNRIYYTRANDPRDTTFKPGSEVFQKNPGELETRATRYWYDHRTHITVEAPDVVKDGETPPLRILAKSNIDLKEGTSEDFYLGSRFTYQPDPPEKTVRGALEAKSYSLEVDNRFPTTVSGSSSAVFGPVSGDRDTRGFLLNIDSGVTGYTARTEMTWIYRRDKNPAPNASVAGAAGGTLAPSTHGPGSPGSMAPGSGGPAPAVENLAPSTHGPAGSVNPSGHVGPPADGMVLIAPDLVVVKGSRVLVPVRLLRAHDVLNMDFQLSYQPEVATALPDPQRGSLVTNLSQNNLVQPGLFKFNFAQLAPVNGDGSVAGFRFDATGAAGSRTPLTLEVHTVNNSQGVRLPIRVVSGSITIYDPHQPPGAGGPGIPGGSHPPGPPGGPNGGPPGGSTAGGTKPAWQPTCSGSGVQTMNDALCCLKMWVGLTPRGLFMDLDNNNEVDSRDAVIVMQNVGRTLPGQSSQ